MSKLKVEFNYSTIALTIQLFSYSTIHLFNYTGEGRGRSVKGEGVRGRGMGGGV